MKRGWKILIGLGAVGVVLLCAGLWAGVIWARDALVQRLAYASLAPAPLPACSDPDEPWVEVPVPESLDAPRLSAGLQAGTQMETVFGPVVIEQKELGKIRLPSGRICASDGIVMMGAAPFRLRVPPGAYPVVLGIAHYANDERVALAAIRFQDVVPRRWCLADTAGADAGNLGPDHCLGYPVDSGTGAFLDALAFEREVVFDPEKVIKALDVNGSAIVTLDDTLGIDLAVYSIGMGDGTYASYWGLDANGRPAWLVTDFGLLDPPSAGPTAAPTE
jgi:hypothetical protein